MKELKEEIYILTESNKSLQERMRLKDEEISSLREEISEAKGVVKTKPTVQENLWDDEVKNFY
jgi:chromosome segregation ATPase